MPMAQAVGRIGQPVQQDDDAKRLAIGFHDVGAVPVLSKARGINRARLEIAIDRHALVGRQLLADLGAQAGHDRVLLRQVASPVGRVELLGPEFLGNEGMPRLQGGAAERPKRTQREQRDADHEERHK
jgi:hypothetical protein